MHRESTDTGVRCCLVCRSASQGAFGTSMCKVKQSASQMCVSCLSLAHCYRHTRTYSRTHSTLPCRSVSGRRGTVGPEPCATQCRGKSRQRSETMPRDARWAWTRDGSTAVTMEGACPWNMPDTSPDSCGYVVQST